MLNGLIEMAPEDFLLWRCDDFPAMYMYVFVYGEVL